MFPCDLRKEPISEEATYFWLVSTGRNANVYLQYVVSNRYLKIVNAFYIFIRREGIDRKRHFFIFVGPCLTGNVKHQYILSN